MPAATPRNAAPPTPARRRKATRRMFLRLCGGVLGVSAAAPLEARCIEPYAIETTRHEVFLPDLPAEHDGLTVAQMTDLHRGRCTPDRTIRRAVTAAAAARPDIVVLTGDFVNRDPADAAPLARLLRPLQAPLGVWGCLGNHDYHDPDHITAALEQGAGVRILRNASAPLAPGLWIAGIEDIVRGRPNSLAALAGVPEKEATVFLTHNPTGVWKVAARPYLVLSGHTHGGQICIPGLPPRVPPGMEGFPLIAGWGIFDRARLYVSRGVGMSMLPMRFACRPEVALITLRRGDAPPRQILPEGAAQVEHVVRAAVHRLA